MSDDGKVIDTLRLEALRLQRFGYPVFPLSGKAPLIAGWQTRILTPEEVLRELLRPSVTGIGFSASAEIAVLDFDGEGHRGVFEYVLTEIPELEDAPLVRTGSGKEHVHFSCPGMPPTFTNQRFPRPDLKAVVELRGHRSNCVLPPSVHPDTGRLYAWERDPEFCARPEIAFDKLHSWLSTWAGLPYLAPIEAGTPSRDQSLPVGRFASDFIARGWPLGCPSGVSQRWAVLRVVRNLLSAGWTEEEVLEAVWVGLALSPWDSSKGPWTKEEVRAIVQDLRGRPPPPLRSLQEGSPGLVLSRPDGLRVLRVDAPASRLRTVPAEEVTRCRP